MIKMKSDRPLLIDGVALTEFETNEQHAKELELAGRATRVDAKSEKAPEPQNKMASSQENKSTSKGKK